jgi:hypothetical protein
MRGRRGGRGHGHQNNGGGAGRGVGAMLNQGRVPVGRGRGAGRYAVLAVLAAPPAIPPDAMQQAPANDPPPNIQQQAPFVSPGCPRCNPLPLPGVVNLGSADEMLRFGLGLMAVAVVRWEPTNRTRFRAHYGISPAGSFALYSDLKQIRNDTVIDCCYLLMALNFLKCYETEPCMASRWGFVEEKTRIKVREYVQLIQQMKLYKVSQSILFAHLLFILSHR